MSVKNIVDRLILSTTQELGLTYKIDDWRRYKILDWELAFIRVDYNPELDWLSIRFSDRWYHANYSFYVDDFTIHAQDDTIALYLKEELENMIERHKAYNQITGMIQKMKEMGNSLDIPIQNMIRTIYGELETQSLESC